MATQMNMSRGAYYSALLHGIILLLLIFGLPGFFHRKPDPEPIAISVDILPMAPISNVKPQEKTPEKPPEKKPVEEKKTAPKAAPETKKEEAPKEEPIPLPPKETLKKVVEKKLPEKKKPVKKPEEDLSSILKSVKDTAKAEESKKPTETKPTEVNKHPAKSEVYDASMPLSLSEKDAIRNQIQRCWDVPAGAKNAENLIVTLRIEMNEDGSVASVDLMHDESRYASDSFFRAAADSAKRAVIRCSPLKDLPHDKYGSWRDMEITFNPKDML